jgi:hypothetical protein
VQRIQKRKVSKIKKFFFEKKNQKTFAPLRAVLKPPGSPEQKFFAEPPDA